MRTTLLVPCLLALACSEYGLMGRGAHVDEPSGSEVPVDPTAPSDDTDAPVSEGEPDCDLAPTVRVEALDVYPGWDFDDQGRMLAVLPSNPGEGHDIVGVQLGKGIEKIATNVGYPRRPWWTRALPDGNIAYVSEPYGGDPASGEERPRIGMVDPNQGVQVALTSPDFQVRVIEPDVDGTIVALGYANEPVEGHSSHQIRRFDLYSGFSDTLVDFDDETLFVGEDLALAPGSDTLYVAGWFAYQDKGVVYAVARLGPWTWGDPVEIWTGGKVHGIAVDACKTVYISEGRRLLALADGATEAQQIAELPGPLLQPVWGSGHGDWAADVLYGYWEDMEAWPSSGFVAVGLDVDGTHILAR